jgi:hypothetical protein
MLTQTCEHYCSLHRIFGSHSSGYEEFWDTMQCSPLKSQPTFWKTMFYKFSSLGKQYHKNVHSVFAVSCEALR